MSARENVELDDGNESRGRASAKEPLGREWRLWQ